VPMVLTGRRDSVVSVALSKSAIATWMISLSSLRETNTFSLCIRERERERERERRLVLIYVNRRLFLDVP